MKMLNIRKIEKKFANILKRKGYQGEVYAVVAKLVYSLDWEDSKDYWVEIYGRCGKTEDTGEIILCKSAQKELGFGLTCYRDNGKIELSRL